MRNDFFLGPKIFEGQSESFICCKSLFDGYNHFGSKNSIREILALENPESRKSSERLSASTEKVRNDWVEAINSAVEHYQENRGTFLTTEEEGDSLIEEKLGDVKPVLFPRGLADTCQVGILLEILVVIQ